MARQKSEGVAFATMDEKGLRYGQAVIKCTDAQASKIAAALAGADETVRCTPVRQRYDVFGKMFWVSNDGYSDTI